jgi:hypothetical protein
MTERIRRRSNQSWPEHVLSCLTQVSQPNPIQLAPCTFVDSEQHRTQVYYSQYHVVSKLELELLTSMLSVQSNTPACFSLWSAFYRMWKWEKGHMIRCEYSQGKSNFLNTYDQNPEMSWMRQKEMGKKHLRIKITRFVVKL